MRMRAALLAALALVACRGAAPIPEPAQPKSPTGDPRGEHETQIGAIVKPFLDGQIVSAIVVGVYDNGKQEIYGYGEGPGGKPPDGHTLFEIGSITKVFTGLLFADAVQRKEVELEAPLADFLPPGVTAPTEDGKVITLKELAVHSSGLPRLPPSLAAAPDAADPYGKYDENRLYADLSSTKLDAPPGTQVQYSNYGAGVLGFVLGKKLGGGYRAALQARVLGPLELRDTMIDIPDARLGHRIRGTNDDLQPVAPWTWDALAGAGAIVSDARDLLQLAVDELDASQGGDRPLLRAMKYSQEPQLEHDGDNEGLGWMIDPAGRYWHNGATGGYHSFIGFDPKHRRAIVLLVATQITPIDRLADLVYAVLDGKSVDPPKFPHQDRYAMYAGSYDFSGTKLDVVAENKRLYIAGPGEPRHRLVPLSDHEFWIEELQGVAIFDRDSNGGLVLVFIVGGQRIQATRIGPSPPEPGPPPVPVSPAAGK